MKKFFGIILFVFGALWTLTFLITFNAGGGYEIFASIVLVAIGIIAIIIGIKLSKKKKVTEVVDDTNSYTQTQVSSNIQEQAQVQQPLNKLSEVRSYIEQKLNNIPYSEMRVSATQLAQILFNQNDSMLPFEFQASNQKNVDMIAHWRLADVDYLGILGLSKHNIQEEFNILIKFDELNKIIRCKDKLYRKKSSFGMGGMSMGMSSFSGKSTSVKKEIVFGKKKDGSIGKVVDVSLDTKILHNAIKTIAKKNGWEVKYN